MEDQLTPWIEKLSLCLEQLVRLNNKDTYIPPITKDVQINDRLNIAKYCLSQIDLLSGNDGEPFQRVLNTEPLKSVFYAIENINK